tara:strand:+ start:204 stop:560 length:357 start_codon:yes stop_codon:yes gene_type:complete
MTDSHIKKLKTIGPYHQTKKKTEFIKYIEKKYTLSTYEDIDYKLYEILTSETDDDFRDFIREIQMERIQLQNNYFGGRKKTKSSSKRTAKSKSKTKTKTYKKKENKRKSQKTKDKRKV